MANPLAFGADTRCITTALGFTFRRFHLSQCGLKPRVKWPEWFESACFAPGGDRT